MQELKPGMKKESTEKMQGDSLKKFSTVVVNGKRKMFITHVANGNDKRKEAADIVLGNKK